MAIVIIPITYLTSYVLLSYYTKGDQVHYHKLYDALHWSKIENIMLVAYAHVNCSEPITAFILWIGAHFGIEKNIYISLLNVILIVSLFLLARKHRVKSLMIGLLLTNFYVVVLMTGAERLKIAYIFLMLAGLCSGKMRFLLAAASPLAHLQSFLFLSGTVMAYFEIFIKKIIFRFLVSKKKLFALIVVGLVCVVLGYTLFDGIERKAIGYFSLTRSPFELVNISILSVIVLYISHKRFRMLLALFPMFPAVFLLGGMRVNMIAVTLSVYYLMEERRLEHPLTYLLMIYFFIKTVFFVHKIFVYGNGFA